MDLTRSRLSGSKAAQSALVSAAAATLPGVDYSYWSSAYNGFQRVLYFNPSSTLPTPGVADHFRVRQVVPFGALQDVLYGTAAASNMMLSFWARSNYAGTEPQNGFLHLSHSRSSVQQRSRPYSLLPAPAPHILTMTSPLRQALELP